MLHELHKSFCARTANAIHNYWLDHGLWRVAQLKKLHLCNPSRPRKDTRESCARVSEACGASCASCAEAHKRTSTFPWRPGLAAS